MSDEVGAGGDYFPIAFGVRLIDEDFESGGRKVGEFRPNLAGVSRNIERSGSGPSLASCRSRVECFGVGWIDRHRSDGSERIWIGEDVLVGMIRVHLDAFDGGGLGVDHVPGVAAVFAAPEGGGHYVNDVFVVGIEDEKFSDAAEVEHAPGLAAVVGDVGAGHVAGDEDGVFVVRADDRAEHGAAAAGADDFEVAGALGEGGGARLG